MKFIQFKKSGSLLIIISQLFLTNLPTQAEYLIVRHKKSARRSYRQVRKSGAIRTDRKCVTENNTITLFIPEDNQESRDDLLKSSSNYPTFAWHLLGKSDFPVKFTLVAPDQTLYTKEMPFKNGLMTLTLPTTVAALEVGGIYRWTVSILCDRDRPSRNPFTEAWIERANLPPELENKKTISCNTYKESGFWYDAVNCHLEAKTLDPKLYLDLPK